MNQEKNQEIASGSCDGVVQVIENSSNSDTEGDASVSEFYSKYE